MRRLVEYVFFLGASSFSLKFSRIPVLRKRLPLLSNTDLTMNVLNLEFVFHSRLKFFNFTSVRSEFYKSCSHASLVRTETFLIVNFRGFLVCSLNVPVFISHNFSDSN